MFYSSVKSLARILVVMIGASLLTLLLYGISIAARGPVSLTPLENIDGITYPVEQDSTVISESFAHSNILLASPRFAKALQLTITFSPGNADRIGVAVRENSFWFSYHPVYFYDRQKDGPSSASSMQKTVLIPLTDKIQHNDQSLDMLFIAENGATSLDPAHNREKDTVVWYVKDIVLKQKTAAVTWPQAKTYLKRVINRERPI